MASGKTKSGNTKKKASAKANATARVAGRRGTATSPRVSRSERQVSQGRFPGETPLTGEDRPATRAGAKKGRGSSRKR